MRFMRGVLTWTCGAMWLMLRSSTIYVAALIFAGGGLIVTGAMTDWSPTVLAFGALFGGPIVIGIVTGLAFEFHWDRTFHLWFIRLFARSDTPVWVIKWSANRNFWVAQMSAADHPLCPPETLRRLSHIENHAALVARHSNTPEDVLLRLAANYPACWKALVGRSQFSVSLAEELRQRPLCELDREQFCRNPNVPEQVLADYAHELLSSPPSDLQQHLLAALATNPSLPAKLRVLLTVSQYQTAQV